MITKDRPTPLLEAADDGLAIASVPTPTTATIRRIRVPAWAVGATGSAANALVLGQLIFWIHADAGRRAHAPAPDRGILGLHVFKSARELAAETGLSASQVERAIATLRQLGIIATKVHKFRGSPTNAVWLTPAGLAAIHDHEGDRRAVSVLPSVVACLKGVNAALLVSQLIYWFTRRDEDGNLMVHAPRLRIGVTRPWIAKTDVQLADETALSQHQIKRARGLLVRRGWIKTSRRRFGEGTATFYELQQEVVAALMPSPKMAEEA